MELHHNQVIGSDGTAVNSDVKKEVTQILKTDPAHEP